MGCLKNYFYLFRFVLVYFAIYSNSASGKTAATPTTAVTVWGGANDPNRIPIGVVFDQNNKQVQQAFKIATIQHSNTNTPDYLNFEVFVDVINTADSFKLSRLVCNQFSRGVVSVLAAVQPNSFGTFHSYANTFHMPIVVPFFPEKVLSPSSGMPDYAISIQPDYHKAVLETVNYYGWKNVIYMYDSEDGMLRMQEISKSLIPGKSPFFRIANVKRIKNSSEAVAYLRQLEMHDRWSNKFIIMDCSTAIAKNTLIKHVRDLKLGRRNYHYLFTGLVFDEPWEKDIPEYGTIKVTGFKLIDTSRKFVKDFFAKWKLDSMAAKSALMYDATHVVLEGFQRIRKQEPHIMDVLLNKANPENRFLNCDTQEAVPLKYGEEISEFFKRTQVEGLSGHIQFSSSGVRKNFSLVVVENNAEGDMIKIGTWYDDKGFQPLEKRNDLDTSGEYDRNKTYTVVSIHEPPYFMSSKPRQNSENADLDDLEYTGFCVELAELIAEKLQIKIKFQLSADGKYGHINPNVIGGWDGMVGELVRNEIDMVVAPLIVSEERESAVDFSKPFLSFNQIKKQPIKEQTPWFGFLKPFSFETWCLLASSLVLVSIVKFVVSRFAPIERRVVTFADEPQRRARIEAPVARVPVRNELSFSNSVWYSVGSILYHGFSPRSISGNITSIVFSLFTVIVVCSYTAYMTSQLTISGLESPLMPVYVRMAHCPEDMLAQGEREMSTDDKGDHDNLASTSDDTYSNCKMLVTVLDAGVKDFAVAFPKGSKLRTGVNLALTALREEGILNRLVNNHFHNSHCGVKLLIEGGTELTLGEVVGLFYILLIGILSGLLVAVYEYHKYNMWFAANEHTLTLRNRVPKTRLEMNERPEALNPVLRRRRDERGWNGSGTTASRPYGYQASMWSLRGKSPRHILSNDRRRQILAQEEQEAIAMSLRRELFA